MTEPHLPDPSTNGAVPPPPEPTAAVKRHRRPSVRLGEIGDGAYDPVRSRPKKNPKGGSFGEEERDRMTWRGREPKAKGSKRVRPSAWGFGSRGGDDDVDGFDDDDEEENEDVNNSPVQSLEYRGVSSKGGQSYDNDTRNYWNGGGGERNGIRVWLNQLGLGRYAPVFEIHEVDDEVLPMLTIEDLKDMGINAVGSRRKMYSAIQKLNKGFS